MRTGENLKLKWLRQHENDCRYYAPVTVYVVVIMKLIAGAFVNMVPSVLPGKSTPLKYKGWHMKLGLLPDRKRCNYGTKSHS